MFHLKAYITSFEKVGVFLHSKETGKIGLEALSVRLRSSKASFEFANNQ